MVGLWPAGWAPACAGRLPTATAAPLILSVAVPDALQRAAEAVRGVHAPEAAARTPAHLTLFRHLPGLELRALVSDMRQAMAGEAPTFRVQLPKAWNGRWVAPVGAPGLDALRAELAQRWHGLLAPGDLAHPHLHISLSTGRSAPPALPEGPWRARGLLLWAHQPDERGGPFWTPLVALAFRG